MPDHISLPKSTLLKFSKNGNIKFLDLKSNKIIHGKAATYNTREAYYSKNIEKFLSGKIETKIGRLSSDIEKYRNDGTGFSWNPNEIKKIAYGWIIAQWIRTNNAKEDVRAKSVFKDIFPAPLYAQFINENFDKFVGYGEQIFEKLPSQGLDLEVSLCILPKACKSTFLLSTTHFIGVNSGLFFILSPYSCVFYAPKEHIPEEHLVSFDDEAVDSLIRHFIKNESLYGDGHLIGFENQLLKAKKYVEEKGI